MSWIEKEKLKELMELRDQETLRTYGGVDGILKSLNSSVEGLDLEVAGKEDRIERYGKNEMLKPSSKSFFRLWFESFNDLTLIILIVLAIISLIIAFVVEKGKDLSWLDGTAILITVVIVTLVGSINTYSQEKQFQKLNERQKERLILAYRGGEAVKISIFDVLVGDILIVSTGDVLPADGLVVQSADMQCDEAPMTGESELMKKNCDENPFLLCGCKVQTGNGKMIVTAVGMNTQFGVLKRAVLTAAAERTETPLQQKLDKLAKFIGYVGFTAAGIVFLLLFIFWLISFIGDEHRKNEMGHYIIMLIDYLIIAVTIIVMAVPEGLPLAVTISLAYSMRKMLADNNLVRRLASCETMGGATTICSDKTGTLTMNKMKVTAGFYHAEVRSNFADTPAAPVEGIVIASASSSSSSSATALFSPPLSFNKNGPLGSYPPEYVTLLAEAIALNSTGDIRAKTDVPNDYDYLGNVTECAMLLFLQEQGIEYAPIRRQFASQLVQAFPFSSEKKRMSVIYRTPPNANAGLAPYRIFTKGASEIVCALCTHVVAAGTTAVPITADVRAQLLAAINTLACEGLRTIALAYKDISDEPNTLHSGGAVNTEDTEGDEGEEKGKEKKGAEGEPFGSVAPESDLRLVAIVGIKDPLRPEVPDAIVACRDAHIVVRMVTGDNIDTAMNIAKECGIYDPKEGIAMEGVVFRNLPDDERIRILPRLQVLARSSPIDKQILVGGLQTLHHTVAVTGDGTNDAPALSKADVGFAMGITGTEVAKDAAAIILTDDNFASIVKAAMWGRNVYDSIRKFLQFQLTVNFSAIIIASIGAVFAITPLKAVQMLWVNLIMDTLAALALATEIPTLKLLSRRPYGRDDPIICRSMWRDIIGGAIFETLIIVMLLFLWGPSVTESSDERIFNACHTTTDREYYVDASEVIFNNNLCRTYLLGKSVVVFSNGHFSLIFNTFIWIQMFNLIACRKCYNELNFFENLWKNTMFYVIWLIISVLQVFIMLTPGVQQVFSIVPLPAGLWGISIAGGVLILPFKFCLHLLLPAADPFGGDVPIVKEEGVPAGVYKAGAAPPAGCTLASFEEVSRKASEEITAIVTAPVSEPVVESGSRSGDVEEGRELGTKRGDGSIHVPLFDSQSGLSSRQSGLSSSQGGNKRHVFTVVNAAVKWRRAPLIRKAAEEVVVEEFLPVKK